MKKFYAAYMMKYCIPVIQGCRLHLFEQTIGWIKGLAFIQHLIFKPTGSLSLYPTPSFINGVTASALKGRALSTNLIFSQYIDVLESLKFRTACCALGFWP